MLLEPPVIPSDPNATILTNSGKYAHYGTPKQLKSFSWDQCIVDNEKLTLIAKFFLRSRLDRKKLSIREHERLRECRMDWCIAEKISHATCPLETDRISFILVR